MAVEESRRQGEDMEVEKTRQLLASQDWQAVPLTVEPDGDDDYCIFWLRSLIPDGRVSFPLFLKTLDRASKSLRYLPFCGAGGVFRAEWLARLAQRGLDRLYFLKEDLPKVIAYLNNYVLYLDSAAPDSGAAKMTVLYDHLHLTLQQALASYHLAAGLRPALAQADRILAEFERGALPMSAIWETLCTEYNLYNHAVNIFLIATGFMTFLKKASHECRAMGQAALFHDVGLLKIPREILYKPGPLDEGERLLVRQHPQTGYNMLKACQAVPLEALRLILEHHENSDGSGYPQRLELWRQHPYTQILRLVDAYDALTSHRPHRPARSAFQAVEVLQKQQGPEGPVFDQSVLKRFMKFLVP